jgi:hypothetical protein
VEALPLESWREFLELERCAGPLLTALAKQDRLRTLADPVERLLRESARRDAERSLRAERDGRWLGHLAHSAGIPVVILKGGAAALSGQTPALNLEDLDVLIRPEHAEPFVKMLRDAGYSEARRTRDVAEYYHRSDRLPLDLHWGVDLHGRPTEPAWTRAVPVAGVPGLLQFTPRDQLEHVVVHTVVHHAERLPRLRDLILIGASAAACDEVELRSAEDALSRHRHGAALDAWLQFARRLWSHTERLEEPCARSAAGYRLADALSTAVARGRARPPSAIWRFAAIESGRLGVLEMVHSGFSGPPTNVRALAYLQRGSLAGDRAVRALRALFYLISLAVGAPATAGTRWALRTRLTGDPAGR